MTSGTEKSPTEWETGLLKIFPKKLPGNYRRIMLLESAYKIIADSAQSLKI